VTTSTEGQEEEEEGRAEGRKERKAFRVAWRWGARVEGGREALTW